ncbi:protein-L-isoaspartate O-methyltransferase [Leptospira sp. 201903070]|jgi:protein-L-isoaspartate(D-aspartate) O-methyltransferase|uniref:Protein-L-isoaspartate O-methyltransferase n=1 Tax=Leptospira ainlahdjerensis TaxID=2810033 RepID=A0ABS2UHD4_9LEPT|nr:protein-L-isoaspartate O-methyltransferase [Leptospira ainlahdjerensis]MBM9578285.1 protein-L-isoaspartate O-methyltransferase [Leptospira ainlahdjerensis]
MSSASEICDPRLRRLERERMVKTQIVSRGIRDRNVLSAMLSIPRECFIPSLYSSQAYEDKPLPIGCKQTISQPFMVAWMSTLLEIEKGDRVFEIGTGSGYQSAVLDFLGGILYSVEFFEPLHKTAIRNLERWKPGSTKKHRFMNGSGPEFLKPDLFFEKMISCASLAELPDRESPYFRSLVPGGIFVFPTGKEEQVLMIAKRTLDDWSFRSLGGVRFVPFL